MTNSQDSDKPWNPFKMSHEQARFLSTMFQLARIKKNLFIPKGHWIDPTAEEVDLFIENSKYLKSRPWQN